MTTALTTKARTDMEPTDADHQATAQVEDTAQDTDGATEALAAPRFPSQ
jgi:hypothetical protein